MEEAEDGVAVFERLMAADPERELGEEEAVVVVVALEEVLAFIVAACVFEPPPLLGRPGSLRGAEEEEGPGEPGGCGVAPPLREAVGELVVPPEMRPAAESRFPAAAALDEACVAAVTECDFSLLGFFVDDDVLCLAVVVVAASAESLVSASA